MFRDAATGSKLALHFAVVFCAFAVGACSESEESKSDRPATTEAAPSDPNTITDNSNTVKNPQTLIERATDEQTTLELPSIITIRAQLRPTYSLIRRQAADYDYTNLSGILDVQSYEPEISETLQLLNASSTRVVMPPIGNCNMVMLNFSATQNHLALAVKRQIGFFISGIDATNDTDDCDVKLMTMSMTGFTTEFENVRLGAAHSTLVVPKVRLEVSPFVEEQ